MKILVFGGSGLIGRSLVSKLRKLGHEVTSASPSTGINTLNGEGLEAALSDTAVTVDVTNSPSFADEAVLNFFKVSTANILRAASAAGVKHHVVLSVVGAEKLVSSGYMKAKVVQEGLVKSSTVPYTIVRATQFFEFVGAIASTSKDKHDANVYRLSSARFQPLAAEDISEELARVALAEPLMGMMNLAGPQAFGLDYAVRAWCKASGDASKVLTDESALYYGADVGGDILIPEEQTAIGKMTFETWLTQNYVK